MTQETAPFWPWPWWTAILVAFLCMWGPWIAAKLALRPLNRKRRELVLALRAHGLDGEGPAISINGDRNGIFILGTRIAVADMREGRVVQTMNLAEAAALKTYEGGANQTCVRIVARGGAQTRKVATSSIVAFAKLFALMTQSGKQIEYIQE